MSPPRYSTQTTDRMKVQPLTCGRVTPLRYFYSLCLTEHLLCISLPSTHAQSHIKSIPVIIPCQCSFKKKNLLHGLLKHYLGFEYEFEQQDRLEIKDDNIITLCYLYRQRIKIHKTVITKMKKFTRHSCFSILCCVQYHVTLICVYSILTVLCFPSLFTLFVNLTSLINID